jgi:hypothetical protein
VATIVTGGARDEYTALELFQMVRKRRTGNVPLLGKLIENQNVGVCGRQKLDDPQPGIQYTWPKACWLERVICRRFAFQTQIRGYYVKSFTAGKRSR